MVKLVHTCSESLNLIMVDLYYAYMYIHVHQHVYMYVTVLNVYAALVHVHARLC